MGLDRDGTGSQAAAQKKKVFVLKSRDTQMIQWLKFQACEKQ
jgi:hypothetical protein